MTMVIYGQTDSPMEVSMCECTIGDDFSNLPDEQDGYSAEEYDGCMVYSSFAHTLPRCFYFESKGKIESIIYLIFESNNRIEALEEMAKISKALSDKYTSGNGERSYKRSRNYVYNKDQGIILDLRLERFDDTYAVIAYVGKYSLLKNLWDGFKWNFISLRRPGFNLARMLVRFMNRPSIDLGRISIRL